MFNGIIKNTGVIKNIKKNPKSMILSIQTNLKVGKSSIGSSISCDGVCLTLTSIKIEHLTFYLSSETIKRSNFANAKIGKIINLEKSIKYGDEVSGHYTQGHVDTVGKVLNIRIIDKTWIIKLKLIKSLTSLLLKRRQYILMVYL